MSDKFRTIIESVLLPHVQKPMRYAGGELNCIRKDLSTVAVHGVLCFPDLYDIGMSHTGLQILYHLINRHETWALSRCFHPWGDAEAIMRREKLPLYALEYFTPVREADWIGFSVQYELHYTNIVNMLDLAGISPLRSRRTDRDPLIMAGGPCVGNPEPLAPFVDLFVIGDGEEALVKIVHILECAKSKGTQRDHLLWQLAEIEGVYVPALHTAEKEGNFQIPRNTSGKLIRAAKIPVLDDKNYPEKPVVPLIEVVHHRLAVEVMRGCTRGCRFCSAGFSYRPVRERTADAVADQIQNSTGATGWQEVGLLSLSTADYSPLTQLLQVVQSFRGSHPVSCALPSTRLDALSSDQLDLLDSVSSVTSFTIAPEAGSERLRKVINKDFTDDTIYGAVHELVRRNVQTLKLYFMLGLPTEGPEDIAAIVAMVTRISGMVRAASGRRTVNVALSPFSPKPHTPFQRERMESPRTLIEKGTSIKLALRHLKNVKVTYRNPDQTVLETVLARGDRTVGNLVYHAWQQGARFDGWDECFNLRRWTDAAAALSIDIAPFLNDITPEMTLPWSIVSTGVSPAFLEDERQRAYRTVPTVDCRKAECHRCGICTSTLRPVYKSGDKKTVSCKNNVSVCGRPEKKRQYRYRFFYGKTGLMRFLGHLDMVAIIHRACLMANVPLAYTQGFNPHPRIAFGPPLPFGISGVREAFDIVMTAETGADPLVINRWLPEGLEILANKPISDSEPSLNDGIHFASYEFICIKPVNRDEIAQKIEKILSVESIIIEIERKGEKKEKDIRRGIVKLAMAEEENGWNAVLSIKAPCSCKPSELLGVLLQNVRVTDILITRKECYNENREGI